MSRASLSGRALADGAAVGIARSDWSETSTTREICDASRHGLARIAFERVLVEWTRTSIEHSCPPSGALGAAVDFKPDFKSMPVL